MTKPSYLDSVHNAFSEARAWKVATLFLGVVSVLLAHALVSQARNQPVALVPYDAATTMGRVNVTTSGELKGTSSEYMANLAIADLGLILNFTPENVLTTTKRFLNRVTDGLYREQENRLIAAAEDNKLRGVTQSFFPSDVRVSTDRVKVEVDGLLLASMAGKETLRTKVTYVLTYESFKGIPHVSDIQQAKK